MMRHITVVVLVAAAAMATPKSASANFVLYDDGPVWSANKRYFAVQGQDQRSTAVFKRIGKRQREKVWEIPAWSPALYLTDDGEYLVVGYEGANLLPQRYRVDQTMVSFYHRTTLIKAIRLDEIILDRKHLDVSDSGVEWGFFVGLVATRKFALDTVEHRRLVYDVSTGDLIEVRRPGASSLVPPG